MVTSPWLTVTSAKGYTLSTAQTRILITAGLLTGNVLLPSVTLPVYVELASATASLGSISCSGASATQGVSLNVVPSVGKVAIASVSATDMANFAASVPLASATLVNVPLVAKVTALSQISLGGVTTQTVNFSMPEITAQTIKTVSTRDLTQGITTSLVSGINLQASLLGGLLPINLSGVTSLVGGVLGIAAPLVDNVLFTLTDALGVRIGAADVQVNKLRCGTPTIVA